MKISEKEIHLPRSEKYSSAFVCVFYWARSIMVGGAAVNCGRAEGAAASLLYGDVAAVE